LTMAKVDSLFEIYGPEDQAIKSFHAHLKLPQGDLPLAEGPFHYKSQG
jgi:hypothetical protein